jgi:hypothetical protein
MLESRRSTIGSGPLPQMVLSRLGFGYWGNALPAGLNRGTQTRMLLQELPGHDHALDLVGALVDLGDSGPSGSFRR